ncbi:MAG: hypothetical protein JWM33_1612 [Caulobacteraceae bacterium]|nr:hypothetical protein [Caulobacteraceae bacterium]
MTATAPITILVVDDEDMVRLVAVELLEEAGFKTFEANCASEAVEVLQAHDDITVVFTDIDMPGPMDGVALAFLAQKERPGIGLIITSGRPCPADRLPVNGRFLAKPYGQKDVVDLIAGFQSA